MNDLELWNLLHRGQKIIKRVDSPGYPRWETALGHQPASVCPGPAGDGWYVVVVYHSGEILPRRSFPLEEAIQEAERILAKDGWVLAKEEPELPPELEPQYTFVPMPAGAHPCERCPDAPLRALLGAPESYVAGRYCLMCTQCLYSACWAPNLEEAVESWNFLVDRRAARGKP